MSGTPPIPSSDGPAGWPAVDPADPLVSGNYLGWWRRTLVVVDRCWRQLLVLHVLGALLSLAVSLAITVGMAWPLHGSWRDITLDVAHLGAAISQALTGMVIFAVVQLAVAHLVLTTVTGAPATASQCLRAVRGRVLPTLGWSFVASVLSVAGLFALAIPGVYLFAVFTVLPVVIAFERRDLFRRCFSLFHRSGRVALIRVGSIWAVAVTIDAASLLFLPASSRWPLPTVLGDLVTTSITAVAAGIVLSPLTVTAYADMRARTEPLSTDALAADLTTR